MLRRILAIISLCFVLNSCGNTSALLSKETGILVGKETALKKMDVYYDLSCEHCKKFFSENWDYLQKKYIDTGLVKAYFHDFPTSTNPLTPHNAAWCASAEGAFVPFMLDLYSLNIPLKSDVLIGEGKKIGLGDTFQKCVEKNTYIQYVEFQKNQGLALPVPETPYFTIDQDVFNSTSTITEIEKALSTKNE